MPRFSTALALILMAAPLSAPAQTAPSHITGTIARFDGSILTIDAPKGAKVTVTLAPGFRVVGLTPASLDDIKPGEFVGVGSVPAADGSQTAVEVTLFPPNMAGTGEGSRPWDVRPQGTMTNATVQTAVQSIQGHSLTLTYPGGTRTVLIPPDAPIVMIVPATEADLIPGAAVSLRGQADASGMFTAKAVIVGLKGTVPPM